MRQGIGEAINQITTPAMHEIENTSYTAHGDVGCDACVLLDAHAIRLRRKHIEGH